MSRNTAEAIGGAQSQRWLELRNVDTMAIPKWGACEIVATSTPSPGRMLFHVRRPTAANLQAVVVNGPVDIPAPTAANSQPCGQGTMDWPAFALVSGAVGGTAGTASSSFVLSTANRGFRIIGSTLGTTGAMPVRAEPGPPPGMWRGHLASNTAITSGSDSDLSWTQTEIDGGAISHSGTTLTINEAGVYLFSVSLCGESTSGGAFAFHCHPRLKLNGSVIIYNGHNANTSNTAPRAGAGWSWPVKCSAGDTVILNVLVQSLYLDISLDGSGSATSPRCVFSAARLY